MTTDTELEKLIGIKNGSFDLEHNRPGLQGSLCVLFTSTQRTLKALEKACELAGLFGGRISVVATQIVPFPLPLDEPQVPFDFVIKAFAEQAGHFPAKISIVAYLCRDRLESLKRILAHNSVVLAGIRKGLWPSRDERLVQKLQRAGYAVLPIETE